MVMSGDSNVEVKEQPNLTSPLLEIGDSINEDTSQGINDHESVDIWKELVPLPFVVIRYCLQSNIWRKFLLTLYLAVVISTIVAVCLYLSTHMDPHPSGATIAATLYDIFETIVVMALPFYAASFIRQTFAARDVAQLFRLASSYDPYLWLKFRIITWINVFLIVLSIVTFVLAMPLSLFEKIFYALASPFYLMPFCYMYTMVLFILEAHRQCALQFYTCLCSSSQYSVLELKQQYIKLQTACRNTSRARGKDIFALFVVALLFIIYSIWNLYQHDLAVAAMLAYVIGGLVTLIELGYILASTNEMGSIICREVSTVVLCSDYESNATEAMILLQCIHFAKLEIPFFGNFVLRPQTLIAVIGSALGAIIPGFVLRM